MAKSKSKRRALVSKEFVQQERQKHSIPSALKTPAEIDWYLHGIA